jgi:hypothetical protein
VRRAWTTEDPDLQNDCLATDLTCALARHASYTVTRQLQFSVAEFAYTMNRSLIRQPGETSTSVVPADASMACQGAQPVA